MGKYLISGVAGTGKTTVIKELAKRGFAAYSTDEMPEVTQLQDLRSGQFAPKTGAPIDFSRYGWNWQESGLKKLLASRDPIFIGASVSNQEDFNYLFDAIFVLSVDEATLKHRLATRTKDDDYGKHPDDLARVLAIHKQVEHDLIEKYEAVRINANQSLKQTADEILEHCHDVS